MEDLPTYIYVLMILIPTAAFMIAWASMEENGWMRLGAFLLSVLVLFGFVIGIASIIAGVSGLLARLVLNE